MSNVPEGAQLSDDGQWWWDAEHERWKPVEGGGGAVAGDAAAAATPRQGAPAFDFDNNGLLMSPENSPVESAGEPLKASFSVCNTGTAAGSAHVTLWIDGSDSGIAWDSPELAARPVHGTRRRLHPRHPRPVRGAPQVRGLRRPARTVRGLDVERDRRRAARRAH